MPFTPFHFGPGILLKALLPRHFWLTSFLAANVLIDVEVLYYLLRHEWPIHRTLHSYAGSTAIGVFCGIGMFAAVNLFRRWVRPKSLLGKKPRNRRSLLGLCESILGGIVGGTSHILLDSLMHRDMQPYWPFAEGNGLLGAVSVGSLHLACAAAAVLGIALWLLLQSRQV